MRRGLPISWRAGGRGRRFPRGVLREMAVERAGIDDWLFEECYQAVGDLAETIAHVLPPPRTRSSAGLAEWIEQRLLPLRGMPPDEIGERLAGYWDELDWSGRFLLTKLIGGGFRVGVSRLSVIRALAEVAGVEPKTVAQRIVGYTGIASMPSAAGFSALIASGSDAVADAGQPYPFFLAHQLNDAAGYAGTGRPVDGRMEVGRHPRTTGQARRRDLAVVARRGAGDRPLSGIARARSADSRRHGASTARSSCGRTAAFDRSPRCRRASEGNRCRRKSWPTRRPRCSPTTCWKRMAPICACCRSTSDARASSALVPAVGDEHLQLSPLLSLPSWDAYARAARRVALARRRRLHAQAPRRALRRRPDEGIRNLVEMEDRPDDASTPC